MRERQGNRQCIEPYAPAPERELPGPCRLIQLNVE